MLEFIGGAAIATFVLYYIFILVLKYKKPETK